MGFAGDGDLLFLHDFQQCALHLGRRAVDFVGQQQIGEDRPPHGGELAGALVIHARADQVGGQQVGRELDALERAAHGPRQRVDRQRLGQPRHAFDQQVPARKHRHQHTFEKVVLPHDHALHLVQQALHQVCAVRSVPRLVVHRPPRFRKEKIRWQRRRSRW
ncbi:hypothetical protein D3C72_1637190 [compost metagenome]